METLAQKAARISAAEQARTAEYREVERREKELLREREKAKAEEWATEKMYLVSHKILKAAGEGKNSVSIVIAKFETQVSEQTKLRMIALKRLLRDEDLVVHELFDRNDPCGFDSYFDTTVYSASLSVEW